MSPDLVLRCPSCEQDALADDDYCERCGTALGALRDDHRHQFEIDRVVAAAVSHRGLVHSRNEDALFLEVHDRGVVAVVCDGVSASAAPQVAAQVAAGAAGASLLAGLTSALDTWSPSEAMTSALEGADTAVLDVRWMPTPQNDEAPSCTIVAAVWDGSTITIGWSGDSRAYWIGSDEQRQLTSDHSWAQRQIDAGLATAEEALSDPRGHAITRWLGADAPGEPYPVMSFAPPGPGLLVVCSDGLWNHLDSTADLAGRVRPAEGRPLDVARDLLAHALRSGGHDNVTVAVVALAPMPTSLNQEEP